MMVPYISAIVQEVNNVLKRHNLPLMFEFLQVFSEFSLRPLW